MDKSVESLKVPSRDRTNSVSLPRRKSGVEALVMRLRSITLCWKGGTCKCRVSQTCKQQTMGLAITTKYTRRLSVAMQLNAMGNPADTEADSQFAANRHSQFAVYLNITFTIL